MHVFLNHPLLRFPWKSTKTLTLDQENIFKKSKAYHERFSRTYIKLLGGLYFVFIYFIFFRFTRSNLTNAVIKIFDTILSSSSEFSCILCCSIYKWHGLYTSDLAKHNLYFYPPAHTHGVRVRVALLYIVIVHT